MESDNDKKLFYFSHPTLITLVILLVAIVVSYYIFFSKKNSPDKQVVTRSNTEFSLAKQIKALNARSKIPIPSVASNKDISSRDLPIEIINMIGANAVYNNVKSVVYDSSQSGYEIEFTLPDAFRDSYFSLFRIFKDKNWRVIYGSRYNDSGIVNIENDNYFATLLLSHKEDNSTLAKATIINKKNEN